MSRGRPHLSQQQKVWPSASPTSTSWRRMRPPAMSFAAWSSGGDSHRPRSGPGWALRLKVIRPPVSEGGASFLEGGLASGGRGGA